MISDGDMRRNLDGLLDLTAGQVATREPVITTASSLAAEALALMNDKKIGAIFVVAETGAPVGILHIHDCLRAGVA